MSWEAFRLWALPILARHGITNPSDTDGSPEGPDPQGLDGEAATAGAVGIAKNPKLSPEDQHD